MFGCEKKERLRQWPDEVFSQKKHKCVSFLWGKSQFHLSHLSPSFFPSPSPLPSYLLLVLFSKPNFVSFWK